MDNCNVLIVGTGPYGLSLGAHLRAAGVDFRIIGRPMEFWLNHMPKGMHLKSEGFASSLFDPGSSFTLGHYCREHNLPYGDLGMPVPLERFSNYGLEFQKRYVPDVIPQKVAQVERSSDGFRVTLDNGDVIGARRVVVAVGLTYYEYMPDELAALPREAVSHSSRHGNLEKFKGREVAVVGAGASALDIAAILHEVGASVQLIARVPKLKYHDPPENTEPTWFDQIRNPVTGIGLGWKLWMCANLPLVFRLMPESFRIQKVKQVLGPAPCWFIRDQVEGKVKFHLGRTIQGASYQNGRVKLELRGGSRTTRPVEADHVSRLHWLLVRRPQADIYRSSDSRSTGPGRNVSKTVVAFRVNSPESLFCGCNCSQYLWSPAAVCSWGRLCGSEAFRSPDPHRAEVSHREDPEPDLAVIGTC